MNRMALLVVSCATAASLLTAVPVAYSADMLTALGGRYSHHFLNGDMEGNHYWSDNVVEIVPVAADAAYVRVELQYANGHSCSFSGVGQVQGGKIIYVGPNYPPWLPADRPLCVLTVARQGRDLRVDDGDGSCYGYCGARGTLSNVRLPFASRRPINYMQRLKASLQYMGALSAWQGSRGQ